MSTFESIVLEDRTEWRGGDRWWCEELLPMICPECGETTAHIITGENLISFGHFQQDGPEYFHRVKIADLGHISQQSALFAEWEV